MPIREAISLGLQSYLKFMQDSLLANSLEFSSGWNSILIIGIGAELNIYTRVSESFKDNLGFELIMYYNCLTGWRSSKNSVHLELMLSKMD